MCACAQHPWPRCLFTPEARLLLPRGSASGPHLGTESTTRRCQSQQQCLSRSWKTPPCPLRRPEQQRWPRQGARTPAHQDVQPWQPRAAPAAILTQQALSQGVDFRVRPQSPWHRVLWASSVPPLGISFSVQTWQEWTSGASLYYSPSAQRNHEIPVGSTRSKSSPGHQLNLLSSTRETASRVHSGILCDSSESRAQIMPAPCQQVGSVTTPVWGSKVRELRVPAWFSSPAHLGQTLALRGLYSQQC